MEIIPHLQIISTISDTEGILINADLNGAANILRKAGYDTSSVQLSRLLNPKIIRFADLNSK